MTENGEEAMSPTYFMQSTHNTVGSALAIYTKTHGYNTTYSHGNISFDLTVQDAWMQMQLGKIKTALVGGQEEMTDNYFGLLKKTGYVGQEKQVPCGEMAMSMMLTTDPQADHLAELAGIRISYRPTMEQLQQQLDDMLAEAGIEKSQLNMVMVGLNGQRANDELNIKAIEALFEHKTVLTYKHLFGENYTASAMGLYATAHILNHTEGAACCLMLNLNLDGESSIILIKR